MAMRMRQIGIAIAIAAGAAPAVAAGKTVWFYERQPIPVGQTREVPASSGELILGLKPVGHAKIPLDCEVSGRESFWNELEVGRDETKSIAFACTGEAPCTKVTITPYLPWTSTLMEASAWPLPDEWRDVRIGVRCGVTDYGVFSGNLTPGSGDGDEQGRPGEPSKDEADSFVGFRVGAGNLVAPNGDTLSVTGFYHFGSARGQEVVTGEL